MGREYLLKGFFWHSYFERSGEKKVWISKQSYTTGFVSSFAGITFMFFLYLTLGAAVDIAYRLFDSGLNIIFFLFILIYVFLMATAVLIFFKDIFSAVRVEYFKGKFTMATPISVKKYVNMFFLRESHKVQSELVSIAYSRMFFDFFSKGAQFYYNVHFIFANGERVKFPLIHTTADILSEFLDDVTPASRMRFGHFSKIEVEQIAKFFGPPAKFED